ncbi:MAG: hypothetical protein JW942_08045 [Opitutales bacterium]|nr:hypothetical protein [Opitutales bacterium]
MKTIPCGKLLAIFTLVFALAGGLNAQYARGRIVEGKSVNSDILGRSVNYSVYLPYDYDSSERQYPVVYLLHGLGDSHTGWTQFGEIQLAADKAIAEQTIAPMIIVMPAAERTWYVNNYDNSVRYEDFFFEEFIPEIESTYRIRSDKLFRGIAGLSMGGYGSLVYSMRHPDMFAACAAFSSGIECSEDIVKLTDEHWNSVFGPVFGPDLKGEERIGEHFQKYDVLNIARTYEVEKLSSVRFYLDCGDDDFLYRGNAMLHIILRDRGVYHENRMRNGPHNWSYWRSGITDGLAFISESFHQK